MDAKKLLKELTPEATDKERLTLWLDKRILARIKAKFPRNRRPSVSEVTERLWLDFLDGLDKGRR